MKAQDLVNNGKVTVEELLDFVNGDDNWEHVQDSLNEVTGFNQTVLDFCVDEKWDTETVLKADLIEGAEGAMEGDYM